MVDIRLASAADLPAIGAIFNHFVETSASTFTIYPIAAAEWSRLFDSTHGMYPWLVATDAGAVVGFAKASPYRPRDAYAYTVEVSVFVAESSHRRGVARRLYDRLFAVLHNQGYYTAIAVVTVPNPASEGLHAKVGMRAIGTIENAGWKFDRWHSTRLFQIALQDEQQTPGQILSVENVEG